jgi:histidyl-tRNA synthetase
MANKPGIPKGTRDFSPAEMAKRNYIFNTIREVYALYGFQQIETPAMENLSTLMGSTVTRVTNYSSRCLTAAIL